MRRFRQRPHRRVSKKGKPFKAGKGSPKPKIAKRPPWIVAVAKRHKIYLPPAWKNVRFHKDKEYIFTGIDAKGRIQYVYPKTFSDQQKRRKFKRVNQLEKAMPEVLKKIYGDLAQDNQEAQATYVLYKTGFRPGARKDTLAEKKAYGVTTMLKNQVKVKPNNLVEFDFTGKKGVPIHKVLKDRKLAAIIKSRKKDKKLFNTNVDLVRSYFNKKTKGRFQLKDLRTLKAYGTTKQVLKKGGGKKEVGRAVSVDLGNTPTVALQAYVNPTSIS